MNDAAGQVVEQATYCQPGDEKRPQRVGLPDFTARDICPADISKGVDELTDAYPDGWYVRIMFDELLDPTIEDLTEIKDPDTGEGTDTYTGSIAGTKPVKLQCESVGGGLVDVPYDGYYSPAGNAVTWPLGPSLVIKPNDARTIATGKECTVTVNDNVTDKSGEKVPSDQRVFKFKVAPITVIATDPTDSGDDTAPTKVDAVSIFSDNAVFSFNTEVDIDSFCPDPAGNGLCNATTAAFDIKPLSPADAGGGWGLCDTTGGVCSTLADCTAGTDTSCDYTYAYTLSGLPFGTDIGVGPAVPLKTDTDYTISLRQGAKLADRCGVETTLAAPSTDDLSLVNIHTNKFDLNSIAPGTGDTVAMVKKPTLSFSNVVDPAELASTEFTISPTPDSFALGQSEEDGGSIGGDIVFGGNYAPNTTYTITINKSADIKDPYGATYTFPDVKTIMFKTQASVQPTTFSPADEATVQKVLTVQPVGVTIGWNANMKLSSFTAADFTFVDSHGATPAGLVIGTGSASTSANCSPTSLSCSLRVRADLPPDTYTFTLKAGAMIEDVLGNVYTQAADKVIHFTVKAPPPAVVCQ